MRAALASLSLLVLLGCVSAPSQPAPRWSLVVHGGAGVVDRAAMTPDMDAQYRAALRQALSIGGDILAGGGSALDAVEATIMGLEDDPLFNAGRGAVFTAEGRNELDASIMDGRARAAGAVTGVTRTRHPISAARAVMERSPHVLLAGEGADAFAAAQGSEQVEPNFFFTERRWRQLEEALREQNLPVPQRPPGAPAPGAAGAAEPNDHRFGTVGVAAYDVRGDIAAGTSTGGLTAKRWNRVGDSPIIGAGTYAQNGICGVSATGAGEYFIRVAVARSICARMELQGASAQVAADAVIAEVGALGGDGGVIVVDGQGRAAWSMNTSGMYRASLAAGGEPMIHIFADEE